MFISPQLAQSVTCSIETPEILIIFTSTEFGQSATCSIETPYFSLFSHHRSLHSQLLALLLHRTAHYVHIFAVCTFSNLFYWNPELLIMFISPEFTHSVTWCIDTSNSNFFPITTDYTDNYIFYWHTQILIMFTSTKFSLLVTCSIDNPIWLLFSHHHNLHILLLDFWHIELFVMFTLPQ
jgi:hypothetical protein